MLIFLLKLQQIHIKTILPFNVCLLLFKRKKKENEQNIIYSPPVISGTSEFTNVKTRRMRHMNNENIRSYIKRISLSKQFGNMRYFIPTESRESGIVQRYVFTRHDIRFVIRFPRYLYSSFRGFKYFKKRSILHLKEK